MISNEIIGRLWHCISLWSVEFDDQLKYMFLFECSISVLLKLRNLCPYIRDLGNFFLSYVAQVWFFLSWLHRIEQCVAFLNGGVFFCKYLSLLVASLKPEWEKRVLFLCFKLSLIKNRDGERKEEFLLCIYLILRA